ncbi:MAG TPA: SCO6880 family protein [Solirubrobacteraceae bacterium]|nr:SCO6880 family protein [Solirubrobacteraceae bacterium]
MSSDRLSYRFGPLERHGLLGPLTGSQACLLMLGAALAVSGIDLLPPAAGIVLGLAPAAGIVLIVVVPVGGRTVDGWAGVGVAFLLRGIHRRERRFISDAPARGMRWHRPGQGVRDPLQQPPPEVGSVSITEIAHRGRSMGVLAERRGYRLTAVLACRAASFALLDPEAQERRLARWGLVLSASAATSLHRLQWIERTSPARADGLARWLHQGRDPATPPRGTPIVESYLELISGAAKVAQDHEILVVVQVDRRRLRKRDGLPVEQALIEQTERVARGLEAAEIRVLGALSPGQLSQALRTSFDPFANAEIAALQAADGRREGVSAVNAWPLATREWWDRYTSDGAHHVTYWIGGWPRVDVSPLFMDALLGSSEVVRSVSVTFEPVAAARSTREVEAAVTRDRADRELRRRFGQSETARQRLAQEAAARREAELAAGHAEVRLAGFVTVSGRDEAELRRACGQVTEHAAQARLELHRLYGQQADAFTFTLPLARGLR